MDRPDLGKLTAQLLREIIRRETPILERAGLEMWDYVILSSLLAGDAATQRDLAAASGRDKTRLIGNLDALEGRGLVSRSPDPADRRNKVVSLTAAGRRLVTACRSDIRAMEGDLLSALPAADRAALERALVRLVDL
ncbi:MarR family winged helix-turn-helix transcriptional regulator [Nocardioides sp. CER19]|uniref:MarR family winged helix-turn-helix transcriptional regulator n=1 Tax=Nocardioides sp. CER19 TaxID=3038538 RepID=UPI002446C3D7|nr:MarR family winged helix-turn-helix transcriptional regulator [Nocardioides sp. CER19]MDH2415886.1 MarR family winged helix-turn-helix transcriptional regulator [Nocardioides sp. CER19]